MAAPTAPPRPPDPQPDPAYGLAYYRVSTTEQANTSYDEDGFSIQAQREYCQRKAADMGVQLVDEYVDRGKSARTADRPSLQAMLTRIKEDSDIHYVFVHKLDRLARNRHDDVQIGLLLAKHDVRLVSCTENIDDSPSGKLVHGIMADIAEWYSANLGEEAKKGLRKKAENGGTPGLAPLGYVNARLKITELGKDIGVVRVHETFGPLITECFSLYDRGRSTLDDVATYANDRGLRMPANRRLPERPLTPQYMDTLLRNRYYTGRVIFRGVEYHGDHPPLIDDATFERVQALLTARNLNKDKSRQRPHYLKGSIFCARCGRRLGICAPTKQRNGVTYPYFYCLGRQTDKNGCPQGYIPIGDLEDAVRAYWAVVRLPSARIQALRADILSEFEGLHAQGQSEIAKQERRRRDLEQRRKKAKAAYYADVLSLEEFKAEQEIIRQGLQSADDIIGRWSVELASITQALDSALALLDNPQALYDALPDGLKPLLVRAVFEKLWVLDTAVVGGELTPPFTDLLSLEAQLALAEQQQATATETKQEGTYYRQRTPTVFPPRGRLYVRGRPYVERPWGALAIDIRNHGRYGVHGSKIELLVGLARFNLNSELQRYLRDKATWEKQSTPQYLLSIGSYRSRPWRLKDRFSEQDIAEIIRSFKSGTPKHELAEQYHIAMRSLQKLLRDRGVKRRSRWDKAP